MVDAPRPPRWIGGMAGGLTLLLRLANQTSLMAIWKLTAMWELTKRKPCLFERTRDAAQSDI